MDLLNKLTLKNLKLNKKRTIVTIVGIALSVALITAVSSIYMSGIKSLINYKAKENGNFHVAYYDVPQSDINIFKQNREIEKLNITQNIGYAKIDSKNEYKPYVFIKGFTKDALSNLAINLVSGRMPTNSDEIIIPTHLKTNGRLSLNVGDTITLLVGERYGIDNALLKQNNPFQPGNETLKNTTSKTYKIVGIMERPAYNIEDYTAPGYTLVTFMDNDIKSDFVDIYASYSKDGIKDVYGLTADILGVDKGLFQNYYKGVATYEEILQYNSLENKYDIYFNSTLISLQTNPFSSRNITGLGLVIAIVILIIIFTSIFCIKNSFDISITEKTKQYGMLKSVGATKRQIKKNVFYEATILGLIGIPLGIIMGLLATLILIFISNHFLGLTSRITSHLSLTFSFSPLSILIAVILGMVTIYFSAFKSAKKASLTSPITSIKNSASIKVNSKKLTSPKIIHKCFGIGGDIAYKNILRNKKKYCPTVLSLTVAIIVFIALTGFVKIAFLLVDRELKGYDYNLSLSTTDINVGEIDKFNKYLSTTKLDYVKNSTILRHINFNYKKRKFNPEYLSFMHLNLDNEEEATDSINIFTLGDEQYRKYIKKLGLDYEEIKDKGILMDYITVNYQEAGKDKPEYKTLRLYDYEKGDTLSGTLDNDAPLQIEIGYITDVLPFGLQDNSGEFIIISEEVYKKIANFNNAMVLNIYYDTDNASKLQDDIDEILDGEIYNLNNIEETFEAEKNLITLISIFLYGFIIVISLIGITNIFNTITTNMELRKREFAMLKSIGITKKEFNRMIRLESLFLGLKALLIGIPLGTILSYIMYLIITPSTGITYKLPLTSIIISIIVVFLLILLIMNYSLSKINKQNIIETIRNENI